MQSAKPAALGRSFALERSCDEERLEWYRLSPQERWAESQRLWTTFFLLGGQLDPEPDSQSPFCHAGLPGPQSPDGRAGVHIVRRSGV